MPIPAIHYLNQYSHNTLTMQSSYSTSFHRFTFAARGVVVSRPDEIAPRRAVLQQDRKNLFWNVPFQNIALKLRAICRFIVHSAARHFMAYIIPNQFGENAVALMRRISPASSFVNAKHLEPRSFSDAPIR